MDSLETVYPFWAANRQCAPMTATAVMEEPVSADRAKNVSKTLTAAATAVIELVITGNAVHRVQRTQIVLAVHRVICANMLIACVREASADSVRFRIGSQTVHIVGAINCVTKPLPTLYPLALHLS